ncbi:putative non-specific serine/threonine protein kinase [Helianthus anomalus]
MKLFCHTYVPSVARSYKRILNFSGTHTNKIEHDPENRNGDEDLELPLFGMFTLLKATNNFSMYKKLGEGGFGPVNKVYIL